MIYSFPRSWQESWQILATWLAGIVYPKGLANFIFSLTDLNVICDNNTRWNSTFLSLQRAIKLRQRIELFYFQYKVDLTNDTLTEQEWRHLIDIVTGLQPFHEVTLVLEGLAQNAHFGAIWEALPALGVLLERMEHGLNQTIAERNARDPLAIAYQNAWEKLLKYYGLTDEAHSIYAAAILLHPSHRKQYFDYHWTGNEVSWKDTMIKNVKQIWEDDYKPLLTLANEQPQQQQPPQRVASMVELFARQAQIPHGEGDEFDSYINGPPTVFATPMTASPGYEVSRTCGLVSHSTPSTFYLYQPCLQNSSVSSARRSGQ